MNITLTKKPCGKFDITTNGELQFILVYSNVVYGVLDGVDVCELILGEGCWYYCGTIAPMITASNLREIADVIDALNEYEEK
jgi:hypothetical protein